MKKHYFVYVAALLLGSFMLTSCFKDEDAQKREDEKKQIEAYVKNNNLNPVITSSGLNYIERVKGTGDTLRALTDFAFIIYRGKYLDGKLFDTCDTTEAKTIVGAIPWQKIGGIFKLSMYTNFYGMREGLAMMREGGKATLIMPSLIAYNDYTPRIFEIDSFKVVHDIAQYEKNHINDTITALNRDLKDSTQYGSYVFLYGDTTGKSKPVIGDSATIKYSSYIIDGRVFGKNLTIKYKVGYYNYLPVGVDDAVIRMSTGLKARVYMPFYRAWGPNTGTDPYTGQILVPPYSNLKYDIELVSFKRKQ